MFSQPCPEGVVCPFGAFRRITFSRISSDQRRSRRRQPFLESIGAACGNDLVRDTLHRLHTHVRLFRPFHHPVTTAEANREHAVLIAATEAGNPAAAAAAMRHHVQRSRTRFERAF